MTVEGNKETAKAFLKEVIENKQTELLDNMLHDEFQTGELGDHGDEFRFHHHNKKETLESQKQETTFRDRSYEILDLISEGNKIVIKVEHTVTYLRGDIAKGKTTKYLVIYFFYFKDGKIIRYDEVYDKWTRFRQLGMTEHMVNTQSNITLNEYIEQLEKQGYL